MPPVATQPHASPDLAPAAKHIPTTSSDFLFRLSVVQYQAMIDTGVLTEDDPVELLDGLLTYKMPKNRSHRIAVTKLNALLFRCIPPGYFHQVQDPIRLDDSQPEPDLVVIRGTPDSLAGIHPSPADILLVVEVADSTLTRDRTLKGPLYARAGIPHYWIINLEARTVETFASPLNGAYTESSTIPESTPLPLPAPLLGTLTPTDFLP
jgi:Uma2 family endonuclease